MSNATPAHEHRSSGHGAHLSLWDAICLIVGIIIGASIYQAPPEIFKNVSGPSEGMFAWILGGTVSLIGALCYAELASSYRTAGGDYTYLTRAYGPKVGFFFAWAELSVIRTGGSIAFMAYVFANYADKFHSLGAYSELKYAIGSILVLTVVNALGVRPGRFIQNCLTVGNFVGLLTIVLIGVIWFVWRPDGLLSLGSLCSFPGLPELPATMPAPPASTNFSASFALCMVLVFYAYGGWNEAAFIASEVQNPRRNVRRALILGTMIVTLLYISVNLAYLGALGYEGVCKSEAVAADMFALPFGNAGEKAISALVMFSALGSINGLLFTGMRLYGTFGADHKLFASLAGKGNQHHTAYGALFAQAAFSLVLIALVEFAVEWRQVLNQVGNWCGMETCSIRESVVNQLRNSELGACLGNGCVEAKRQGIYDLVTCTAPVFWLFFFLTGCSLFILRSKEPNRERPFRVPLFPFVPILFCGSCLFMLYRSATYAAEQGPAEAIIVAGLMFLGIPLCAISSRMAKKRCD